MTAAKGFRESVCILLVEDNPADADLACETLQEGRLHVTPQVAEDGLIALEFLNRRGSRLPDLIVLDLNLPKKSGMEVLREIRDTANLRAIPVVILSSSEEESDIHSSYKLGANCYIAKPRDLKSFRSVFHALEEFWFSIASLPGPELS